MNDQLNNLSVAAGFFALIATELVILFVGITFLVSLILQYANPRPLSVSSPVSAAAWATC